MTNPYNSLKTKIKILECILNNGESMISHRIAKTTKLNPQTVAYQLNKMVKNGIILKDGNQYRAQDYFSDNEVWYEITKFFSGVVEYIHDETDSSQMENDSVIDILHILIELILKK